MSVVTLPLRSDLPDYDLEVELEGRTFGLRFRYNQRDGGWYMDLLDGDGVAIRTNIRIVLDFPLLARVVDSRRPPGEFFAVDTTGKGEEPGLSDLGGRVQLVYFSDDEFA